MTLDANVRGRLAALAETLRVEEPPVSRMARRGRRRGRLRKAGAALSLVALLGSAGVIGSLVSRGAPGVQPGDGVRQTSGRSFFGITTDEDTSPALQPHAAGPSPLPQAGQESATAPGTGSLSPVPIEGTGPKVIKTAKLTLEVREGRFQDAFADAQTIAAQHGGFVSASGTTGQDARSGNLTIRVPVGGFESALADLKELGVLRSESVEGQDVTAEFVDLQSRLRNFEAQELVLLRLMRQANSIGETLQVHRRLEDVQGQIERFRGQLRVLRDQTDLGTIRVAMHEEGVAEAAPPSKLGSAWSRALAGALDVISAIVVGLGYLLPIAVLLLLLALGIRALRARSAA
ncbi:MAG: DUF4349 domain-containing protein [Actinomycetota bacterium]